MISKYRAFHKKRKLMCEVYKIDFESKRLYLERNTPHGQVSFSCDFNEAETMQLLGCPDINDTEVFEGDILTPWLLTSTPKSKGGIIVKPENDFNFYIQGIATGQLSSIEVSGLKYRKIIGNMYQNPELFEKEK